MSGDSYRWPKKASNELYRCFYKNLLVPIRTGGDGELDAGDMEPDEAIEQAYNSMMEERDGIKKSEFMSGKQAPPLNKFKEHYKKKSDTYKTTRERQDILARFAREWDGGGGTGAATNAPAAAGSAEETPAATSGSAEVSDSDVILPWVAAPFSANGGQQVCAVFAAPSGWDPAHGGKDNYFRVVEGGNALEIDLVYGEPLFNPDELLNNDVFKTADGQFIYGPVANGEQDHDAVRQFKLALENDDGSSKFKIPLPVPCSDVRNIDGLTSRKGKAPLMVHYGNPGKPFPDGVVYVVLNAKGSNRSKSESLSKSPIRKNEASLLRPTSPNTSRSSSSSTHPQGEDGRSGASMEWTRTQDGSGADGSARGDPSAVHDELKTLCFDYIKQQIGEQLNERGLDADALERITGDHVKKHLQENKEWVPHISGADRDEVVDQAVKRVVSDELLKEVAATAAEIATKQPELGGNALASIAVGRVLEQNPTIKDITAEFAASKIASNNKEEVVERVAEVYATDPNLRESTSQAAANIVADRLLRSPEMLSVVVGALVSNSQFIETAARKLAESAALASLVSLNVGNGLLSDDAFMTQFAEKVRAFDKVGVASKETSEKLVKLVTLEQTCNGLNDKVATLLAERDSNEVPEKFATHVANAVKECENCLSALTGAAAQDLDAAKANMNAVEAQLREELKTFHEAIRPLEVLDPNFVRTFGQLTPELLTQTIQKGFRVEEVYAEMLNLVNTNPGTHLKRKKTRKTPRSSVRSPAGGVSTIVEEPEPTGGGGNEGGTGD